MLQHAGHRGVLQASQLGLGEDALGQQVNQHQQQQHADKAEYRGLAHIGAFFGAGREDARTFNADKHPNGDQHHVAHLVHHAAQLAVALAPEVAGKHIQLEGDHGDDDEQGQRYHLGDGGYGVNKGRFLDPAQDQKVQQPQQYRRADDGYQSVAFTKASIREDVTKGGEQQDHVADVADPCADPVAPSRGEAHVVAKARFGIHIHAAVQLWLTVGQGLEHEGQGQHADPGDQPADQGGAGTGAGGDVLRQGENPAADHRADDQRNQCTQSEFLRRVRHSHLR